MTADPHAVQVFVALVLWGMLVSAVALCLHKASKAFRMSRQPQDLTVALYWLLRGLLYGTVLTGCQFILR